MIIGTLETLNADIFVSVTKKAEFWIFKEFRILIVNLKSSPCHNVQYNLCKYDKVYIISNKVFFFIHKLYITVLSTIHNDNS